jgi:DeoC/LacD family aldolase
MVWIYNYKYWLLATPRLFSGRLRLRTDPGRRGCRWNVKRPHRGPLEGRDLEGLQRFAPQHVDADALDIEQPDQIVDAGYRRAVGAQYVKTYYVDDGFETVTASCPVPIVMAGGKKLPELDALTMAYNAVSQGAAGVDMGRNIFQSEAPKAMIAAVGAVVHNNTKPKEALEIYKSLKGKGWAALRTWLRTSRLWHPAAACRNHAGKNAVLE